MSPVRALRARAAFFGEASRFAVVCLRVLLRGLRLGAGVNSSSSSFCATKLNSSSDSSSLITFRRAARRTGLTGELSAIFVAI